MEEMGNWVTDSVPSFAKNLHILLVDHDPVSLQHLASLLEQQSYNVTTAQLASVALSMIHEMGDCFNLVMANATMPDMDSLSFLHALLKQNIAVILMSSGMNLNVATRALAEGACCFLEKPISKDDLKYVWQHVYRKNRNMFNQTEKENFIEKAKFGKESQDIKNVDSVVLSRPAAADAYNNGSNCQQMINKQKDGNKQIESHVSLVGSNFRGNRPINDIEGISKEKRVKYSSETDNSGSTINEDREKRKEYYMSSVGRTRVVWTAERRRKFADAINKLGDKTRPKLILKMMNEPCLTLRQVANHLQLPRFEDTAIPKYKAQVECTKKKRDSKLPSRQASKFNASARTAFRPLLQKLHHETSKIGKERLSSVIGGDRYRLIAPRTLLSPRPPFSHFVNHGLRMLNHNFQRVGLNYNSVSLNINKEVGLSPDTNQKSQNEGSTFHTDSCEKFGLEGESVQISELIFPNDSNMAPEAASSTIFDDIRLPDNLHEVIQQLDLPSFELENQEAMLEETVLPDSTHSDKFAANFTNGSNEMSGIMGQKLPSAPANEGSQPLAEFADLLNLLEDDPYNFGSDLNLSDVERYCEWLRDNVLENGNSSDSFIISDDAAIF